MEASHKGRWTRGVAAGLAGLLIGGAAVALYHGGAESGSASGRGEIEAVVRDYLLANPEIIPQAMERLQQREVSLAVDRHRAALETPFHGSWAGAKDGDVVLVEFFDYACGFCKAANPDVERLLEEDDRLKVVWRELPVLGPDSEAAARISLAAARQGRYRAFHDRLFALGRPTPPNVERAAQAADVDLSQAQSFSKAPEVGSEIQQNLELARAVGASGTPTFVIGDQVLQGAVGYEALKAAVAAARARG